MEQHSGKKKNRERERMRVGNRTQENMLRRKTEASLGLCLLFLLELFSPSTYNLESKYMVKLGVWANFINRSKFKRDNMKLELRRAVPTHIQQ